MIVSSTKVERIGLGVKNKRTKFTVTVETPREARSIVLAGFRKGCEL